LSFEVEMILSVEGGKDLSYGRRDERAWEDPTSELN